MRGIGTIFCGPKVNAIQLFTFDIVTIAVSSMAAKAGRRIDLLTEKQVGIVFWNPNR
jgi:hypothetical protein